MDPEPNFWNSLVPFGATGVVIGLLFRTYWKTEERRDHHVDHLEELIDRLEGDRDRVIESRRLIEAENDKLRERVAHLEWEISILRIEVDTLKKGQS